MQKIKILHITWSADKAGMLTDIISVQKEDPALTIDVCFGTMEGGMFYKKIRAMGIKPFVLGMRSKYNPIANLLGAYRLRKIITKKNYDIIHLQEAILPFPFLVATSTSLNTKIILHNRGEFHLADSFLQYLGQQLKKLVYKILVGSRVHRIICNSQFAVNRTPITKKHKNKMIVIYNAIDLTVIERVLTDKAKYRLQLRKELGVSEDTFIISVVARLVMVKRIDRFIRAFANVCLKNKHVLGLIVGDGPMRRNLEKSVKSIECNDRISFLGHRMDAKEILAGSDISVLPSTGEAFGISALEALALNVPVLVFKDVGGPTEFIVDGENGFIVKDEKDLITKINLLLNDNTLLTNLSRGINIQKEDFDITFYTEKIKQVYASVI
ncbi:MAG: glycosyltransferase family 4 protein [Deltaproteobacteria bacterium]|uniref:glycosyltransferase family 4 protein n=1 Tax=Desulfobacula sp. TaxID=2593537 RepID=UPI0019C0A1D0|nr:glycosyltransferase family 4 protein [Candidatus Desulfobacula maris]MBL6992410.1 glycosyltransferase family 4 protein [Desulfobacula sp.]